VSRRCVVLCCVLRDVRRTIAVATALLRSCGPSRYSVSFILFCLLLLLLLFVMVVVVVAPPSLLLLLLRSGCNAVACHLCRPTGSSHACGCSDASGPNVDARRTSGNVVPGDAATNTRRCKAAVGDRDTRRGADSASGGEQVLRRSGSPLSLSASLALMPSL
jgi:hypothetical protein